MQHREVLVDRRFDALEADIDRRFGNLHGESASADLGRQPTSSIWPSG